MQRNDRIIGELPSNYRSALDNNTLPLESAKYPWKNLKYDFIQVLSIFLENISKQSKKGYCA